jgi:O-antigen/teichoic acid export membrane protein
VEGSGSGPAVRGVSAIGQNPLSDRHPSSSSAGAQPAKAGVARNALYLAAGQAATMALGVALSGALARLLGAADYGSYFLVATMSTLAYVIAEWGQDLYVIREVARHPERAGTLLGSALALRATGAFLVVIPTAGIAWVLGYDARTRWLAVALVAATLPFFLAQGFGMVFRGRDRMGRDAAVGVANKLLTVALALPALLLGLGIPGVFLAQAIAGVGAVATALWLYRRIGAPPVIASARVAREVLVGGTSIFALTVANSAQPYLDAVILSKLVPDAAVGWYGAAKNVIGTLIAPSVIVAVATYPRLSRAAGQPAELRRELRAALRPILWLGALGGVGTYLFADVAISLIFGMAGYSPATAILKGFAPALFLLYVDVLIGHALTACGRARGFAVAKTVSIVVGTGLCLVLVPAFQTRTGNGGIGVAVANALSEFVVFGGAIILLPRGTLDGAIAADATRAILSAGVTLLLFHLAPPMPPLLAAPLCVLVFALASVALGLVTWADLASMKSLLGGREGSPAAKARR